jgi:hypothetical protein
MFEYTMCFFVFLLGLIVYNYKKSRNTPSNQIKTKYNKILKKFNLRNLLDDVTMTQRVISGKLYDTYDCEIRITYNGRTHHGYFKFLYCETSTLVVSGRPLVSIVNETHVIGPPHETQTIQCADLCMMLFFERHVPPAAQDICRFRRTHYKWNVGRLAYLPMEPTNIRQPN